MEIQITLLPGERTQIRYKRKEFYQMPDNAKEQAMKMVTDGIAVFRQNKRFVYFIVNVELLNVFVDLNKEYK